MLVNKVVAPILSLISSSNHTIYTANGHTPTRHRFVYDDIPTPICNIIKKITDANFNAYLVGGCVRDKLLGYSPKDFDIATDAKPEQLKTLFGRQATIIGRRFQIVHIHQNGRPVEVTTFRGEGEKGKHQQLSKTGQVLVDNHFGTIEEDAIRRDLTINALYYDLHKQEVIDYVDGLKDIQSRTIQLIGNTKNRLREDPVRMLRCIRLANKLHAKLPEELQTSIKKMTHLLSNISSARLLDEFLKLTLHGQAEKNIMQCIHLGVFKTLFPEIAPLLYTKKKQPSYTYKFIQHGLQQTDERANNKGRVSSFYLFGVILWPLVTKCLAKESKINHNSLTSCGYEVIRRHTRVQIPRKFSMRIISTWQMQLRMQYPAARMVRPLLAHKDLRASFAFLQLREISGEIPPDGTGSNWWQKAQNVSNNQLIKMLQVLPKKKKVNSISLPTSS